MAAVQKGRFTADVSGLDGEIVVFLIGMRINKPWKLRTWWPVFVAMPKMLKYLEEHPEKGLLGYEQAVLPSPIVVQYWRPSTTATAHACSHLNQPMRSLSAESDHRRIVAKLGGRIEEDRDRARRLDDQLTECKAGTSD